MSTKKATDQANQAFEGQIIRHTKMDHTITVDLNEGGPVTSLEINYRIRPTHGAPVTLFFNGSPEQEQAFNDIGKSFVREINSLEDDLPFMSSEVSIDWGKATYQGEEYRTSYPNLPKSRHALSSGIGPGPSMGTDRIKPEDTVNIADKFLRHLVENGALDESRVAPILNHIETQVDLANEAARDRAINTISRTAPELIPAA